MRNNQKNKALIAIFVLGALSILFVLVLITASGNLTKKTTNFVLYFDSSLNGLNIGAPVLLKGVKVGQVTKISVESKPGASDFVTPVFIEINDSIAGDNDPENFFKDLIKNGLSAILIRQNLLTGQFAIALDFSPSSKDASLKYYKDTHILLIPTGTSAIDSFFLQLSELPLNEIANKMVKTLDSIDNFVNSDISSTAKSLEELSVNMTQLVVDLQAQISNLAPVLNNANTVFKNTDNTITKINQNLDESFKNVNTALVSLNQSIQSANKLLQNTQSIVTEDSPFIIELSQTMQDISNAANSLKSFTDLLLQNPNAIIFGRN